MAKNVLIVDDSAFMRNVLSDIVKGISADTQVDEADGGDAAIAQCNEKDYDLVLLDIIMANGGGMDVLKEVGSKVTTVVISAVGQTSMVSEATELGAKDYIVKPFDNKAIKETLEKFLQ
jgi:two-component system, chemotaxis family, chemotaxis protein CheY